MHCLSYLAGVKLCDIKARGGKQNLEILIIPALCWLQKSQVNPKILMLFLVLTCHLFFMLDVTGCEL